MAEQYHADMARTLRAMFDALHAQVHTLQSAVDVLQLVSSDSTMPTASLVRMERDVAEGILAVAQCVQDMQDLLGNNTGQPGA